MDARGDRRIRVLWEEGSDLVFPAIWEAPPAQPRAEHRLLSLGLLHVTSTGVLPGSCMPSVAPPPKITVRGPRLDLEAAVSAAAGVHFAELFEALRMRVRLPVQKYAQLLGTSRRTLYNWLETERPRGVAVDRIERISELVDALERHVSTSEIQELLDPEVADSLGALLLDQGFDAASERVRLLIEAADRPRIALRLDALADEAEGEPPGATADELRAAFAAFGEQRPPRPSPKYPPPELTH